MLTMLSRMRSVIPFLGSTSDPRDNGRLLEFVRTFGSYPDSLSHEHVRSIKAVMHRFSTMVRKAEGPDRRRQRVAAVETYSEKLELLREFCPDIADEIPHWSQLG